MALKIESIMYMKIRWMAGTSSMTADVIALANQVDSHNKEVSPMSSIGNRGNKGKLEFLCKARENFQRRYPRDRTPERSKRDERYCRITL